MALTDTEALEALFDSAAGHLTLSPVLPFFSSKQDKSESFRFYDPLSIQWSSSSASSSANTTNSSCAGVHCISSTFIPPRRATIPLDPPSLSWKPDETQTNSRSSLTESSALSLTTSLAPQFELGCNPQYLQNISPAGSPVLPRSISCFDLIGTVGCGAYGKVLLGHLGNDFTRNLHAIKVLRKRDMHQYGVEEVKRELRALRWISEAVKKGSNSSSGVTFLQKFLESFQNEHFVFIVLEYHPVSLANPQVSRRLRLHTLAPSSGVPASVSLPLSFSPDLPSRELHTSAMEALTLVAAELVLGILFLHESGIVHQDLKPANIMISEIGHVVIADFGASTALPFSLEYEDFAIGKPRQTYHSIVLQPQDIITFTPLYAAPELMCRNRAGLVIYDQRVDWWSFGVMLYELATGSVPFGADEADQNRRRFSRRSLGDFSLSFGALEKLVLTFQDANEPQSNGRRLEAFLRALLVEHAPDRLASNEVKHHAFFDPLAQMWEDVAAMCHPPIPNPPTVSLDPDISLSMNQCGGTDDREKLPTTQDEYSKPPDAGHFFNRGDLRSTWPVHQGDADAADNFDGGRDEACMRALRETMSVETLAMSFSSPCRSDSFLYRDWDHQHIYDYTQQEEESDAESQIQPFPSTASLYFAPEEDITPLEKKGTHVFLESRTEEQQHVDIEEIELEDIEQWNPWSPSNSKDNCLNLKADSTISQEHDSVIGMSFADISANGGGEESDSTVSITDIVTSQNALHSSEPSDIPHAIFSPRPTTEGLLLPRSQGQRQVSSSLPSHSQLPTPPSRGSSLIPSDDLEREMGAERDRKKPKRRRFSVPLPKRTPTTPKQTKVRSRSLSSSRTPSLLCSLPLGERGSSGTKHFFKQGVSRGRNEYQDLQSMHPAPSQHAHLNLGCPDSCRGSQLESSVGNTTAGAMSEWQLPGSWSLEERLTISVLNAMDSRDRSLGVSPVPVTPDVGARSSMLMVSWSGPVSSPRMSQNEDQSRFGTRPRAFSVGNGPGDVGSSAYESVSRSSYEPAPRTKLRRRSMKLVKRKPEESQKEKESGKLKRSGFGNIWKKLRRSLTLL